MNKKKPRPINAILIDDHVEKMEDFILLARSEKIILRTFDNVEEGMAYLDKNRVKIDAVILDALSFQKKGQDQGTETQKALNMALSRLSEMKHKEDLHIPYCIYTGYHEKIAEWLDEEIKVFVKGEGQEKLFSYLREQVNEKDSFQIKSKYPEIFEFASKYFDANDYSLLIEVLSQRLSASTLKNGSLLSKLRVLEEAIFDLVCFPLLKKEPLAFHRSNSQGGKISQIISAINEKNKIPHYLYHFALTLYNVASAHGSHKPDTDSRQPTIYTLQALRACLLDLILWANTAMESFEKDQGNHH